MKNLINSYRLASTRTKWFIFTAIWTALLITWSAVYPYIHLEKDRTDIPTEPETTIENSRK
jgi:hypothetical protein